MKASVMDKYCALIQSAERATLSTRTSSPWPLKSHWPALLLPIRGIFAEESEPNPVIAVPGAATSTPLTYALSRPALRSTTATRWGHALKIGVELNVTVGTVTPSDSPAFHALLPSSMS